MSTSQNKLQKRRDAEKKIRTLFERASTVNVIHYSCESFYDIEGGRSPRITSIAVRNLENGQTRSFSIHKMAERNGLFSLDQIEERYDKLEKEMLKEFYEFVERHERFIWLHWNMRDINYGFPAIAHRYSVLGGKPIVVDEDKLYDLARILYAKYGSNYIEHPRMESITKLNNISNKDALSGIDEAEAFKNKEYLKLHRSTLRKVDIIASLAEREWDGTLKTKATRRDMYGVSLAAWTEAITEHWIFKLFGVIGVGFVLAIISFIISLIR